MTFPQDNTAFEIVFGRIESATLYEPWRPFDHRVIKFLSSLSGHIMSNHAARLHPDLMTFGFWCRHSQLTSLQSQQSLLHTKIGRGVSFHIPPSNVPLNVAYSLAVGLLSGNTCIVRLPAPSLALDGFLESLHSLAAKGTHDSVTRRIALVRFGHDDEVTSEFSMIADVRVIWGGDSTVRHIRSLPTKPRSVDISFADRVSLALIRSEAIANCSDQNLETVCTRFVADSLTFDQNACSSPKLVVWHGKDAVQTDLAAIRFWKKIDEVVNSSMPQEPVKVMGRFTELCELIATTDVVSSVQPLGLPIVRIQLQEASGWHISSRLRFGTFAETSILELSDLVSLLNERVQTISYFGYEPAELRDSLTEQMLGQVDRIVPIGSALDFDLNWDGFSIIEMMTRSVRLR